MMTPKLQCQCGASHYGCDCRIVFDDTPPKPPANVVIRCFKNGVEEILPTGYRLNEATGENDPAWTLEYMNVGDFYMFVPEKVFDWDLDPMDYSWYFMPYMSGISMTESIVSGKRVYEIMRTASHNNAITGNITVNNEQAGQQYVSMPVTILKYSPRDVAQVACGLFSTYFLLRNGEVWSCGNNDYGQLGRAVGNGNSYMISNLGRITGLPANVIQIAATDYSFYALTSDSKVWCCGDNFFGQLGDNRPTGMAFTSNLAIINALNILYWHVDKIICGKDFAYFIGTRPFTVSGVQRTIQFVMSCGNNSSGQCARSGPENLYHVDLPEEHTLSSRVHNIACGAATTYFQIGDNEVWTCGNNAQSQCGLIYGGASIATPQKAYTAPLGIRDISCGTKHGLVVLNDGRLVGTGYAGANAYPYIGASSQTFIDTGTTGIDKAIAANDYSLFLRNGMPWVCGYNMQGQLAPGVTASPISYQQSVVSGGNPLNDAFTRELSSFWIQPDGRVFCLGDNTYGQLACMSALPTGAYGTVGFH
jgi:alpha-tubulin suppressor-like RCC1 family protein